MTRLFVLLAALWAGAPAAQINTGAALPEAAQAGLAASAGTAGLVVVFWTGACPWTDRYAPRLADLAAGYGPAGFGFVLVNAAPPDADRPMPEGLDLPAVLDTDGQLAAAFGVTRAPHVFLFGPESGLLYDGAVDDSPASADRVRTPYLAQAMDQSVAGLAVEIQRTQSFGCTIVRDSE